MNRCYVEPSRWDAQRIELDPAESRHLVRVRRVAPGEEVEAFDGAGQVARGEIEPGRGATAFLRVRAAWLVPPSPWRRTLVAAMLKGDRPDGIVQKAVEFGVESVRFVQTRRCVVRLDAARAAVRLGRLRAVAVESAKQSGRARLPELRWSGSIADALAARDPAEPALVASLRPGARPLRSTLQSGRAAGWTRLSAWIGPEGDFDDAEMAELLAAGAVPVTLGPATLRAETAALHLASVLSYEFAGDEAADGPRDGVRV